MSHFCLFDDNKSSNRGRLLRFCAAIEKQDLIKEESSKLSNLLIPDRRFFEEVNTTSFSSRFRFFILPVSLSLSLQDGD